MGRQESPQLIERKTQVDTDAQETSRAYKVFLCHLASCNNVSLCSVSGAQPAHFRSGNFHEIQFDYGIVLIQPWYNFFANRYR